MGAAAVGTDQHAGVVFAEIVGGHADDIAWLNSVAMFQVYIASWELVPFVIAVSDPVSFQHCISLEIYVRLMLQCSHL